MIGWSDLGVVLGVAGAALTATHVLALALRPDLTTRSAESRARAVHTLGLLLTALVAGALLTITRQPPLALGIELVVLGVLTGTAAVLLDRRVRTGQQVVRVLDIGTPNLVVAALTAAAGISLSAGEEGGLSLLVVAAVGALLGAVANAWLLLVEAPTSAGKLAAGNRVDPPQQPTDLPAGPPAQDPDRRIETPTDPITGPDEQAVPRQRE